MEAQLSPHSASHLAEPIPLGVVLQTMILPALQLLPAALSSAAACVQILATGKQESRYQHRAQIVRGNPYAKGPARGLWQNERGGIQCVLTNLATQDLAAQLCRARGVPLDSALVHARVEFDDVLAAGLARLFLFADPRPLPAVDASHDEAWACYVRNWQPGRPHRETWDAFHAAARDEVLGNQL
jgi:hypothetical protein